MKIFVNYMGQEKVPYTEPIYNISYDINMLVNATRVDFRLII